MASAVGVFYNYTGDLACFEWGAGPNPETDEDGNFWDYQWCTEMFMPFSRDGGEGRRGREGGGLVASVAVGRMVAVCAGI
jgi:lysosomal Pro-X carboxypeptidase